MKSIVFLLIVLLALSAAGCSGAGAEGSTPQPQPEPSVAEPEGSQGAPESRPHDPETDGPVTGFTASSDDITLEVRLNEESYGHDRMIGTQVTITNNSDQKIAYVKGSGSNVAPDALKYTLGDLTAVYNPAIMTMDYQTKWLDPGESLELELNFAPYIPKDEETRYSVGNDKDIEYFQSEPDRFSPAPAGTVTGQAVFTYTVLPDGAREEDLLATFDGLPEESLSLDFYTTIR